MSQLVLSHSASRHRSLTTGAFPIKFTIGKYFSMIMMGLLIAAAGTFYLNNFTKVHTKGYLLRKLELERQDLMANKDAHTVDIAREKALNSVHAAAVQLSMVAEKQVTYMQEDTAVAQGPAVVLMQVN